MLPGLVLGWGWGDARPEPEAVLCLDHWCRLERSGLAAGRGVTDFYNGGGLRSEQGRRQHETRAPIKSQRERTGPELPVVLERLLIVFLFNLTRVPVWTINYMATHILKTTKKDN